MSVMDFRVVAVSGPRAGETGYISCWPVPEYGANVLWSDGCVEAVQAGQIEMPDAKAQMQRHGAAVAQLHMLSRMRKADLAEHVEILASRENRHWIAGGPRSWSKDELIWEALRLEFGE
jgi:hypothetical protein